MRVALAQINPVVGDLLGNADRILQAVDKMIDTEATPPALMVTPELSLWGIHREISCSALLTFSSRRKPSKCYARAWPAVVRPWPCWWASRMQRTIPSIHRCSMPSHWWKPEDGVWQPANSCCPATTCSMRRATSAPVRERHTSHCARGEGTGGLA